MALPAIYLVQKILLLVVGGRRGPVVGLLDLTRGTFRHVGVRPERDGERELLEASHDHDLDLFAYGVLTHRDDINCIPNTRSGSEVEDRRTATMSLQLRPSFFICPHPKQRDGVGVPDIIFFAPYFD